jgi:hypothetical protein
MLPTEATAVGAFLCSTERRGLDSLRGPPTP